MRPSRYSPQIRLPPMRSAPVEVWMAPVRATVAAWAAVAVDAQGGPVVGHGQVGPDARGQGRRRAELHDGRAEPGLALGRAGGVGGVQVIDHAARLLLEDRGAPGADRVQLHPGLEGHAGGQVERVGVGHRDVVVDPVEVDRPADLARGGAGRVVDDRAGVVQARGVGDRGARGLLEAVGGHQAGAGRGWRSRPSRRRPPRWSSCRRRRGRSRAACAGRRRRWWCPS